MTIDHFVSLVQQFQPSFHARYRGMANVVGFYLGEHYTGYRINKGEMHMDNFYTYDEEDDALTLRQRGRRELLKLLVRRHILTQDQAGEVLYG
jgi:hypothetical protein